MSVKKFKLLLRKGRKRKIWGFSSIQHYSRWTGWDSISLKIRIEEHLHILLEICKEILVSDLPEGLQREREKDHLIDIDEEAKIPRRKLFQLWPTVLVAATEYISNLLKSEKIRPSKST